MIIGYPRARIATHSRGLIAALPALALVLSLIPAAALAHDHRVPKSALRAPGDRQDGDPWRFVWYTGSEDGTTCLGASRINPPNYRRKAMTWRPHRKIHVRLYKRHKPTRLVIRMYRRLDDDGRPAGKPRRADYRLQRVSRDARRFWIAGFHGRRKAHHLYLAVRVEYEDVDGCGGTQSMDLAFHLRRRAKS
ncbi:MAG: hypothetical protein M3454_10430 [Actinomycetota bacterium]|nr:hypothetical protein [Actinomycetota bacterium]